MELAFVHQRFDFIEEFADIFEFTIDGGKSNVGNFVQTFQAEAA
jgi:hypothetical protein